ncbi:hypothetical protein N7456_009535 [Penicillium angulare]|uniref:CST complex subunit Stn1 N-terminal domain-containing protein n=1 Tax=Penicillium angulare TaxID=116970 RepID=A0A9W9K5C3_9EURO|nr:hypothetical protein N7456_009535 [Penicillium angulare]
MATPDNADPVIYPAFCFKASPTHFTWVKMAVADVHRLQKPRNFEGQRIFFYKNHPIRFVTIAGLIVARTDIYRRTIITIDDSSGATIEAVVPHSSNPEHQNIVSEEAQKSENPLEKSTSITNEKEKEKGKESVSKSLPPQPVHISATDESIIDIAPLVPGTLVKIKGTLNSFRGIVQLNLERFTVLRDTNAEMLFLEERLQFLVDVLSSEWVLSGDEVERLRREVVEGDVKVAEEREKAMRRVKRRAEREEKDAQSILRRYIHEEREREKEAGVCREEGERVMKEISERKRVKLGLD